MKCNLSVVCGQMWTQPAGRNNECIKSTQNSFIDTERGIGEAWKNELLESMAEARREEKQLPEERGE